MPASATGPPPGSTDTPPNVIRIATVGTGRIGRPASCSTCSGAIASGAQRSSTSASGSGSSIGSSWRPARARRPRRCVPRVSAGGSPGHARGGSARTTQNHRGRLRPTGTGDRRRRRRDPGSRLCCYPDVEALVGQSAARAGWLYGLVVPRDSWLIRAGLRRLNLGRGSAGTRTGRTPTRVRGSTPSSPPMDCGLARKHSRSRGGWSSTTAR
jgi:hypothetical protein